MCVNSLNSQFICVNVSRPVWNVCSSRGPQPVAMEVECGWRCVGLEVPWVRAHVCQCVLGVRKRAL